MTSCVNAVSSTRAGREAPLVDAHEALTLQQRRAHAGLERCDALLVDDGRAVRGEAPGRALAGGTAERHGALVVAAVDQVHPVAAAGSGSRAVPVKGG